MQNDEEEPEAQRFFLFCLFPISSVCLSLLNTGIIIFSERKYLVNKTLS